MSNAPSNQTNSPSSSQGISGKTEPAKTGPMADKSADAKKDGACSTGDKSSKA